jgi:hypothetical protein
MFHHCRIASIVGIFFRHFQFIGSELEQNSLAPLLREIHAGLDDIRQSASLPEKEERAQAVRKAVSALSASLDRLEAFQLAEYSPIKVLGEECAKQLRSISIDLHNECRDIPLARELLVLSEALSGSESQKLQIQRDKDQLEKNERLDQFITQLKDAPPDRAYQILLDFEKKTPDHIKQEGYFCVIKRKIVAEYIFDEFSKGKSLIEEKSEDPARKVFAGAYYKLCRHLDDFAFNKEKVLEIAADLAERTTNICAPEGIATVDKNIDDVREIAEKVDIDDWSKLAFILVCQLAIYREISPYLKRLRYGQYMVNLGWWTVDRVVLRYRDNLLDRRILL